VGNFTYVEKALALGELDGNYFEITLRALDFGPHDPATVISQAMSSLARDGFINYFGTQRVGDPTSVVQTHHIGLALLKEDFDGFLELMLSPTSSDSKDMKKAKEAYQATKSVKDSIDLFPKGATVERLLLRALNRYGSSSPVQVFQSLPYNQKTLYCRGYQSYVWNRVASERIRRFGTKVVPGDLICTKKGDVDAADAVTIYEGPDGGKEVTLSDVVLPLPGYGMVYPPHLLQLYNDILEGDGLSMDKLKNNKMAETSMRGAYRHLIEVPSRVSYSFEEEGNPAAAVVLRYALGSGCYATIALREVMKELRVEDDKGT
jgi:tRNA pseudouridine13 synthase